MGKSFRSLASSVRSSQEDSAPLLNLETDSYAKVIETRGKGQFLVSLPNSSAQVLVYMPPKFRNTLWIRRGSYIIIRKYSDDQNSTTGSSEILHVLSNDQIKEIKKVQGNAWPEDFKTDFGVVSASESEADEIESDFDQTSECESDTEN